MKRHDDASDGVVTDQHGVTKPWYIRLQPLVLLLVLALGLFFYFPALPYAIFGDYALVAFVGLAAVVALWAFREQSWKSQTIAWKLWQARQRASQGKPPRGFEPGIIRAVEHADQPALEWSAGRETPDLSVRAQRFVVETPRGTYLVDEEHIVAMGDRWEGRCHLGAEVFLRTDGPQRSVEAPPWARDVGQGDYRRRTLQRLDATEAQPIELLVTTHVIPMALLRIDVPRESQEALREAEALEEAAALEEAKLPRRRGSAERP
ncbi:MAG: hypothetical protein KC731_08465 [Myxococcales bacterium]|nr:hypothetical protein [Myxococcales bacterium]